MKQEILNAEKKLLEAMKVGDTETLDALFHDDLLFVIPTGQTVTKEMDLSNFKSGNLKIEMISSSEPEVSIIGDNAIASVRIDMKGHFIDHPIDGSYTYTRTWKRIHDQWKVIGGAGVRLPA